MALMCCMFNCMFCCIISFGNDIFIQDEVLYDGNLLYGLINCSPPDVTVSRLPVQFCCILYV